MIYLVERLHIGNALRLHCALPVGSLKWRLLRKTTNDITDQDDPTAFVIFEGLEQIIVDTNLLTNGVQQFYKPFFFDGTTWTAGDVVSATPAADYQETSVDVLTTLRTRLEEGLKVECDRGNFLTDLGAIEVYTASPSLERDLRFPLVTLHMEREGLGERAVGEKLSTDVYDAIGEEWNEGEGSLTDQNITIIGWSLNGDERNALRLALRRLILASLPVFESYGWVQVGMQLEDIDAVNGEYPAPIYQTMGTFTCIAPVVVSGNVDAIQDITARSINA